MANSDDSAYEDWLRKWLLSGRITLVALVVLAVCVLCNVIAQKFIVALVGIEFVSSMALWLSAFCWVCCQDEYKAKKREEQARTSTTN
jgi:hypothetical protein